MRRSKLLERDRELRETVKVNRFWEKIPYILTIVVRHVMEIISMTCKCILLYENYVIWMLLQEIYSRKRNEKTFYKHVIKLKWEKYMQICYWNALLMQLITHSKNQKFMMDTFLNNIYSNNNLNCKNKSQECHMFNINQLICKEKNLTKLSRLFCHEK